MRTTEEIILDEVMESLRGEAAETLIISSLRTRGVSLVEAQRHVAEGRRKLAYEQDLSDAAGEQKVMASFNAAALVLPAIDQETNSLSLGEHCGSLALSIGKGIAVVDNFLTDSECQYFIEEAQGKLVQSSVVNESTGASVTDQARTSSGMYLARGATPIIERVERRIANLLNWPVESGEALQLLKYETGEQYKPHFDYFDPRSSGYEGLTRNGGQRVGTVILYLNDVHAGGCTHFPATDLKVHPKKGRLLFFSYDARADFGATKHAGLPVVDGEKYIITKWLRERSL